MGVKSEPLSWELLDFWRASGLEAGPIIPGTLVVSRDKEGAIDGFAAIGNHPDAMVKLTIEPLVAKSGPIALKVIDCLESLLLAKGMPGYAFYVEKGSKWLKQIERLAKEGIFHKLGDDESHVWYARKFRE